MGTKINHKVEIYHVDFKAKKLVDKCTILYIDNTDPEAKKESLRDLQYKLYCDQFDRWQKLAENSVQNS